MHRSPLRFAIALAVVGLALLAACDLDSTDPDTPVLFQGTLSSTGPDAPIAGSVAAVTQFGETRISIFVQGLEPGETVGWFLREQTCAGTGEIFGGSLEAYPLLEAGETGEAEEERRFNLEMDRAQSYAAEVITVPDEAEVLACADLVEQ